MDTEEFMWKTIYEKLQKQQSVEQQEHDQRIQQVDGGFFERFGSLLRESAEIAKEQEQKEQIECAEQAAKVITKIEEETEEDEEKKVKSDEENEEEEIAPSDTEDNKADYIAVGWNIDDLYLEILYEILHNVGCDVSYDIGQTALFSYIQDAFKMSNEKHEELLAKAEQKEAPDILLNVEIIEAKDIAPKDSSGFTDPFVTLYLTSNSSHRYNTSVKTETLNPVWEEHFALPVTDKSIEDTLCLEVWDFDPAESVREKLGKMFQVKGIKGVRKFVKEVAVTATTGQHTNELVGMARIPLKTIPASGMTMWYSLDKKNKLTRQGVVKVHLAFGSEKNQQVAAQEHRHLLRILLLHELESSQVSPYWWCGNFSGQAEAIITQHSVQSGLTVTDVALSQFAVYSSIHRDHPLNFALFSNLIDKLIKPIQTMTVSEEEAKLFWDSVKRLLPSCFATIRKIRKKCPNEKATLKMIKEVLKILSQLITIDPPENFNLFPANLYGWLSYAGEGPNCDINATLRDAISQGASDWFNYILENNQTSDNSEEGKLQNMLKIIQLVRVDLQRAIEYYDRMFQEIMNFQYAKCLYILYQVRIATMVEPEVVTMCKSLKTINYDWNCFSDSEANEPLALGTKLFELYLALQRFVVLGQGLCPADYESFHIRNFYDWFHGGVTQWLDIAVFKALKRIEKAVELDNLKPVDNTVKFSSSALDTLTIFHQIKIFWDQLNWPDVEGSYTFIAKIIDDICRCCVFYADRTSQRVEGLGDRVDVYEKRFEVTSEWCLAINNIDYVRQSLKPFTDKLGMEDVIQQLSELKSPLDAQRCQHTLNNVIENSIDTVRNKIIELLETVTNKMSPAMKRLLVEGAELFSQDSNSIDKVMRYLDNNLATLHEHLSEDNFNRILEIIWENLAEILSDLIQSNIDKRRPPSFFANLRNTLQLMVKCFKQSEGDSECDQLKKVEYLLFINGLETSELIHQVHLDRWREQQNIKQGPFGELTVRAKFEGNVLFVEVMNARNLHPMDSNGLCDSFVKVCLLPEEKFTNIQKPKTQTQNKTQFPLYDETFKINLTSEQKNIKDGLLLFSIRDKDLFGMNTQFIGEAFLHFNEIAQSTESIESHPQLQLPIHRPTNLNTDLMKALESRQGDKLAKEFVKKFKQKMVKETN
ncbi:protein unc-13 homolog 4B isoform X2 [Agrilus planipennis]|uniref:Protein unc-13 homolog 4B isoform X2 n=1 Tax=Agrilus planipennis TaxID=224129 RepID=A0A1W4WJ95_AGRPL|nr:protein unc-13 homolog 4B isoform X2 [Agrilus planipennis]